MFMFRGESVLVAQEVRVVSSLARGRCAGDWGICPRPHRVQRPLQKDPNSGHWRPPPFPRQHGASAQTPGPGSYEAGGERAHTSLGYGAAFPKMRRTVADVASYASLRSVG